MYLFYLSTVQLFSITIQFISELHYRGSYCYFIPQCFNIKKWWRYDDVLINWLRSSYIVFIILSDRYICATWLLETANEKSFWFCVWDDRSQPYNFYECVCVLATWLSTRMNARDSNISLFILSKLKQLLKILTQKTWSFFPLVICICCHSD